MNNLKGLRCLSTLLVDSVMLHFFSYMAMVYLLSHMCSGPLDTQQLNDMGLFF